MSKKNSELMDSEIINGLIEWFESHHSPGDKGENGRPKAAQLFMKGIKGNIVINMIYEQDLLEAEVFKRND